MYTSSFASAVATRASFLPLTGTSQFADWGLYVSRHQTLLKSSALTVDSVTHLPCTCGPWPATTILALFLFEHRDGLTVSISRIVPLGKAGPQMALSTGETPHGTLCVLLYFKSWKAPDKLWGKELFMGSLNQIAHFSKFSRSDPRER